MSLKKTGWLLKISSTSIAATLLVLSALPVLQDGLTEASVTLSDVEQVLAIVQAESVESAAAAVRGVGAQVIEELAAVKAVGTRLTREQRRELSFSSEITGIWINQQP